MYGSTGMAAVSMSQNQPIMSPPSQMSKSGTNRPAVTKLGHGGASGGANPIHIRIED